MEAWAWPWRSSRGTQLLCPARQPMNAVCSGAQPAAGSSTATSQLRCASPISTRRPSCWGGLCQGLSGRGGGRHGATDSPCPSHGYTRPTLAATATGLSTSVCTGLYQCATTHLAEKSRGSLTEPAGKAQAHSRRPFGTRRLSVGIVHAPKRCRRVPTPRVLERPCSRLHSHHSHMQHGTHSVHSGM